MTILILLEYSIAIYTNTAKYGHIQPIHIHTQPIYVWPYTANTYTAKYTTLRTLSHFYNKLFKKSDIAILLRKT